MDIGRYIQDNLSDLERRRRAGCSLTIRLLSLYQMVSFWPQRDTTADTLLEETYREYLETFGGDFMADPKSNRKKKGKKEKGEESSPASGSAGLPEAKPDLFVPEDVFGDEAEPCLYGEFRVCPTFYTIH